MKVERIFTDHSNIKFIGRALMVLAFSFFSHAQITVAILDTGFCTQEVKPPKNVKILKPIDVTKSVSLNCHNKKDQRRFHGQSVLKTFIQSYKNTQKIIIKPIIIFDSRGAQSEVYWKKAYEQKADFYLVAAGLPYKKAPVITHPSNAITFVAQGRVSRGITKGTKLWPQELSKSLKNVLVIGAHYPATKYDKGYPDSNNLYKESVRYSFVESNNHSSFTGSSYTASLALGRALSICPFKQDAFLVCLKQKEKKIIWDEKWNYYEF